MPCRKPRCQDKCCKKSIYPTSRKDQKPTKSFVIYQQKPRVGETRSYDGSGNNLHHPEWGMAGQQLLRVAPADYADGISTLAERIPGTPAPNVRQVSNVLCKCDGDCPADNRLSAMVWAWGQYIDHTLSITPTDDTEDISIPTPMDDDFPNYTIPIHRSTPSFGTGTSAENPRQHDNNLSSYLDGANVYASDPARAYVLRTLDGSGKLKTTETDNGEIAPPFNIYGLPNDVLPGTDPETAYLCGDVRANENPVLLGLHSVFIREHNRLCDEIAFCHPEYSGKDEIIYQLARKIVGGQQQWITYNEFLPTILGTRIGEGTCYNAKVDASVATEFSTVGYRIGHTMVNSVLQRIAKDGTQSEMELHDAFFNPDLVATGGVDSLLYGSSLQNMERIDTRLSEQLRSFLFGVFEEGNMMLEDLAVRNMMRARDHGIPDLNGLRVAYGLPRYTSFSQISNNSVINDALSTLYGGNIDAIDPWIGALAESPKPGSMVGATIWAIMREQFTRTRVGDRFWFEEDEALPREWVCKIKATRLSDILARNTKLGPSQRWSDDVFRVSECDHSGQGSCTANDYSYETFTCGGCDCGCSSGH